MAYWQPYQGQIVSGCILNKAISINGNAVKIDLNIQVPSNHSSSAFEVLTGYLPSNFSLLQDHILSTPDGSAAMGIYAPGLTWVPQMGIAADTNKWSVTHGFGGTPAATYSWSVSIIVGPLDYVKTSLEALA